MRVSEAISLAALALLVIGPIVGWLEWWALLIALFVGGNKLSYWLAHRDKPTTKTRR